MMNQIPLTDISAELLAEMREKVWMYAAAVFAVDGNSPLYRGTVTLISVSRNDYLLTAAHVWRELRGTRFALSLEADRLLIPIEKVVVTPTTFGGPEFSEWGPDMALIRIPELVGRDIRTVKAFYNVDKRKPASAECPPYETGVWALLGAPAEQSVFGEKEAVLKLSLLASVVSSAHMRDGFDYVDLSYFHQDRPDLPRSYGGISGSGLWRLPIFRSDGGAIKWNGEAHLEGVAFYQKPMNELEGVIRCHGRTSLYDRAMGLVMPTS
jgi:hypothetical protein